MTVEQLIEKLEEFPPTMVVVVYDEGWREPHFEKEEVWRDIRWGKEGSEVLEL